MQETIFERNIYIQPKNKISKRHALNECEGIIHYCGQLVNYKKVTPTLLLFSCTVTPERMSWFFNSLDKHFHIRTEEKDILNANSNQPHHIRLSLTVTAEDLEPAAKK